MKSIQAAQLVAFCDLHGVLRNDFVSMSSFPSGEQLACMITGMACFSRFRSTR
jgi:hypothetical protein